MKMQIKKWVATALVMASACTVCAQETGQDHIKEIFSLAKKSAEEDFNIDFYGHYGRFNYLGFRLVADQQ